MKKIFKWSGIIFGSLVGLVLVAGTVLYFIGNARLNKTYEFPPSNLTIPTDEASLELGRHRVEVLCRGCHGTDLGGVENWFLGGPLGTIDSANLTTGEGGVGREYQTDEDFIRAIRHGIDPEGKSIFMPAVVSTANLSDDELAAVIAYLKTVPPVDHVTRGKNFTPLAKILYVTGMLGNFPVEEVSHDVHVSAPEVGVTAVYGEYLVNTHDCRVCHGSSLNGGIFPDPTITKISPNLTPGGELGFWTEEEFITAIRTGFTPSGHELDPEFMPWKEYSNFYNEELKAIWAYLQSLPPMDQYTP